MDYRPRNSFSMSYASRKVIFAGASRVVQLLPYSIQTRKKSLHLGVSCTSGVLVKLVIARLDVQCFRTINGMLWIFKSLLLWDFHYIAFSRPFPAGCKLTHSSYMQPAEAVLPGQIVWSLPRPNLHRLSLSRQALTPQDCIQPDKCQYIQIIS
jgi:hypothetical protein